ncbi:hypothetical protein [Methylobacterium sp. 37f]|uniref:hypothetical protein n=1 Tax=Methylobacterium sp. 37f TaxID=2817058 RepID=UPI001FFDC142|nr:hypothetical protein [Methylobacterium sp. 37f]MCK2055074.1 hypothetical protein [Methylobacterium sp. 37f]
MPDARRPHHVADPGPAQPCSFRASVFDRAANDHAQGFGRRLAAIPRTPVGGRAAGPNHDRTPGRHQA